MFITIITAILVLGGLIFFHELGHFLLARILGMGVSTFSLGFGKKILVWKPGKTEYALSLVPLGGYVALVGENEDPGNKIPKEFSQEECFSSRPAWQRMLVIAAGPVFNIVLAFLLCWGMAYTWGQAIALPHIGKVMPDSPAAMAGLQAQDTILRVNGTPIQSWEEFTARIENSGGKALQLMISRPTDQAASTRSDSTTLSSVVDKNAKLLQLTVTPRQSVKKNIFGEEITTWVVGVVNSQTIKYRELGFWESASVGVDNTVRLLDLTWQSFVKLAQRVIPLDQLGGPIMIVQVINDGAKEGLFAILGLAALLSINLGILNLLPIPVLDGGQLIFCLFEMILRRPVPALVQTWSLRFGMICLAALMLLATANDILRLIRG